VVGAWR